MKTNTQTLLKPGQRLDWETPGSLFKRYDDVFHFTLDAAASPHNAKCARYFTETDNGLVQDWGTETVWLNPPYGPALRDWMKKAYEASTLGATVVCLVPARVDTRWWHEYVERGTYHFLKGRVSFVGAASTAPFPCAVVVFRPQSASAAA